MTTDTRADWIKRAATAVGFGGRALDPNARGGVDTVLVHELFTTAVVALGTALDPANPPGSTADAITRITSQLDLPRAAGEIVIRGRSIGGTFFGRRGRGRRLLGLCEAPASSLRKSEATELEILLLKLVEQASKKPGLARATRLRWAGVGVLVFLGVTLYAGYSWTHPWIFYKFKTSSAFTNFPRTGTLGTGESDLLFHTNEEEDPWVEIDLGSEKKISRVSILHRRHCCTDRGIPLRVEVATKKGEYTEVARKNEPFDSWEATFPEQPARWVRLHSVGKTILHLRQIEIR